MTCAVCRSEKARIRHLAKTYGEGKDLLVIENVPVVSCPDCGESYLTAATMQEIERIKANRHTLAEEREVEVVKFEAA